MTEQGNNEWDVKKSSRKRLSRRCRAKISRVIPAPSQPSDKSIRPPPSAEGGGWSDLPLRLSMSFRTQSLISESFLSFLDHPVHTKRQVNPATPLCRGGLVE